MIRKSIYTAVLALLALPLAAQNATFYDSNNQVLTQNRYDKIDGSPYLFQDWVKGVLHPVKGESIRQDKINFNGDSGKFDVVEGNVYIELNAALYNKIDILKDGKTYHFVNRLKDNDLTYYQVVHEGNGYLFLEQFESDLKSQGANYGVSAEKQKFVPHSRNFIWKDGQLHAVNRNTKSVLEFFDSAALQKRVKSQKLNLKKDEDLAAALAYYDERMAEKKEN